MNARFGVAAILALAVTSLPLQAATLYNVQFTAPGGTQSGLMAGDGTVATLAGVSGSSIADIDASETFSSGIFGFDTNSANSLFTGDALRIEQVPSPVNDVDTEDELARGFFQIDVAAVSGTLDLESITFEGLRATGGSSQRGVEVLATVNGGAFSPLGSATTVVDLDLITPNRNSSDAEDILGDLSAAAFQGVTSASFRFYGTNEGSGGVEFGNISINGTLAPVPEPSAIALLAIAGAGLAGLRRRK